MRIAQAGWVVIARGLIGAAAGFLLSQWPEFRTGGQIVAAAGVVFALFAAYFFRDPDRPLPGDLLRIYSPGDGRVLTIAHEGPGHELTVRIFLSVFNVHFQRAPCAGTVRKAEYCRGGFRAAMNPKARGNERCVLHLVPEGRDRALVVEQIAGIIARRIECWVGEGDRILAGERYGMIHFGSQVAVTLPVNTRMLVSPGDRVYAGVTPIAEWTS